MISTSASFIAILRLTTGEDIIGLISEIKTEYQVINPFKVIFRRLNAENQVGLLIMPWLLDELLDEHTTVISKSQVVCIMTPKKEFIDYYHRISDDFYMRLINLDSIFRKQLLNLKYNSPTIESMFRDMINKSSNINFSDHNSRQACRNEDEDEDEENDDNTPTFH